MVQAMSGPFKGGQGGGGGGGGGYAMGKDCYSLIRGKGYAIVQDWNSLVGAMVHDCPDSLTGREREREREREAMQ